jgi:hypothetical protein
MHVDRSRFLVLAGVLAAPAVALPPDAANAATETTCDNARGAPPQCSLRAPGPQCESFHDHEKECPVVRELLDPRVSEAFVECMHRKSGTQNICDFQAASTCMAQALGVACIEPATAATCRKLVSGCDKRGPGHELTMRGCQELLSATVPGQHRKLISSMSESCSARYGYWDLSGVAHGF